MDRRPVIPVVLSDEEPMGRGFTQYSFPDSGSSDTVALYSAFLDYRLPDGSFLHVRQMLDRSRD